MSDSKRGFDDFWNDIIRPAIKLCTKDLDPFFQTHAKLRMQTEEEYKVNIASMYKKKRNWLKREYLPEESSPFLDMHKLSSVLCRCIIGNKFFGFDVATAELLHAEKKKDNSISHKELIAWEIANIYINYRLAFSVAEGVVFDDLLFWAQNRLNDDLISSKKEGKQNDSSTNRERKMNSYSRDDLQKRRTYTELFIQKLSREGKLRRYNCGLTHDDFVSSMVVALMKSDCLCRDFDYLLMSSIMFQWQEHTKTQIFSEIIDCNCSSEKNKTGLLLLCLS